MVETKHTPGPWKWATIGDYAYVIGKPEWPCRSNGINGEWEVAQVDDLIGEHDAEVKANARLIAAAPELLDAAREALFYITDIDNAHRSVKLLRAAIAKASTAPDTAS